MKPHLIALMAASLALASCAGKPPKRYSAVMSDEEMRNRAVQNELAVQRAGQAVVHEAYLRNGVIVTPSRNWMYGQTDAYANQPLQQLDSRDWLAYATAQYGGVMTGEVAERMGTGRSAEERAALQRLEIIGRFKRGATKQPNSGKPMPSAGMSFPLPRNGLFSPEQVISYLQQTDPDSVDELPIPVMPTGLRPYTPRFDLGKNDLKLTDQKGLMELGSKLASFGGLVFVTGFTDPSGTEIFNEGLSERRAGVTAGALGSAGVSYDRMLQIGKPQCCYTNDNSTDAKRALNRRAEITLGGVFVRVPGTDSRAIATAIARVFKTTHGDENFPIRVYGIAPSIEVARELGTSLSQLLVSPDIGQRNVLLGEPSLGNRPEVIMELIPAVRPAL